VNNIKYLLSCIGLLYQCVRINYWLFINSMYGAIFYNNIYHVPWTGKTYTFICNICVAGLFLTMSEMIKICYLTTIIYSASIHNILHKENSEVGVLFTLMKWMAHPLIFHTPVIEEHVTVYWCLTISIHQFYGIYGPVVALLLRLGATAQDLRVYNSV